MFPPAPRAGINQEVRVVGYIETGCPANLLPAAAGGFERSQQEAWRLYCLVFSGSIDMIIFAQVFSFGAVSFHPVRGRLASAPGPARILFLALILNLLFGQAPALAGPRHGARTKSAKAATRPATGWSFVMRNPQIGNSRVRIDAAGTSAYIRGKLGDMLLIPPDYRYAFLINPDNKLFFPRAENAVGPEDHFSRLVTRVEPAGAAQIKGIKCQRYKVYGHERRSHGRHGGRGVKAGSGAKGRGGAPGREIPLADYWASREIGVGKPLAEAICRITGAPTGYGMPLRLVQFAGLHHDDGPAPFVRIELLSAERKQIPDSAFKIPGGYKKAKDITEFMFSDGGDFGKDGIDDLFRHSFKKRGASH